MRFVLPTRAILTSFLCVTLVSVTVTVTAVAADDDWYPSRYGAEDTLGAINELSREGVVSAARLVKTGKTYALGVETGRDTPAYGARGFQLFAVAHGDGTGSTLGTNQVTAHDDWMTVWLGVGTQIDGLGHLGINHRYYNGNKASDFYAPTGLTKFATHTLPPIVTRGVLLDIAGLKGVPFLETGTPIRSQDVKDALARQKLTIGRGDVVILNTGWQRFATDDPERFLAGMPGLSVEAAEWLAEKRVVAIGSDNWGLDVIPAEKEGELFPVHQVLLAKNGIYVLENIRTDQLVADKAWEFLFVLGQPRFVGAVQMVINPVAIR